MLESLPLWLAGAVAVLGDIQLLKSLVKRAPRIAWAIASVLLASLFAFLPPEGQLVMGIVAVSQLGWDTLLQRFLLKGEKGA